MDISSNESRIELLPLAAHSATQFSTRLDEHPSLPQDDTSQHNSASGNMAVDTASQTAADESPIARTSLKSESYEGLQESGRLNSRTTELREWNWEIATWLLATVSLATMLILLRLFHDRPLDEWRSKVSLNAMLAVFSQIAQSALLVSLGSCIGQLKWDWFGVARDVVDVERFDEASRGPQGALTLLWNHSIKHRTFRLVSLGALTTIFIQALSAFTQQAVSLERFNLDTVDRNASMPQALNYTPPPYIAGSASWRKANGLSASLLEPVMMNSIASGMVGTSTLSDLAGTCSTGNCTWTSYQSLGVCASAQNARDKIRHSTNCGEEAVSTDASSSTSACDITVQTDNGEALNSARWGLVPPDLSHLVNGTEPATFWVGHQVVGNGTLHIYIIYEDVPWVPMHGQPRKWNAVQGTLQSCVRDMSTVMVNGRVETKVERTTLVGQDKCAKVNDREICATHSFDGLLTSLGTAFSGQVLITPRGCDNSFDGEFTSNLFVDIYGRQVFHLPAYSIVNLTVDSPSPFPGPIDALGNFTACLDSFAASVTNGLRLSLGASNFTGETQILKPYITVNFYWMVPPVILWVLSTSFLFLTMYKIQHSGAPLWKSSPLVTLYCSDQVGVPAARVLRERLKDSGQTVVLRETGDAWRLEKT